MNNLKYELKKNPDIKIQKIIREEINNFNDSIINDKPHCFNIYVKDNKDLIGGAIVFKYKDAFYVDVIWISEKFRHKGIGSKIMGMIEDEANTNKISKFFVDTYGFQAQEFYQKYGFKIISTVPDYLLGHDRIFMRKDITVT
tara:strand:+ start:1112 stop:1537 length:426 start_codon:yes stop_codon:yes gene_type:complete